MTTSLPPDPDGQNDDRSSWAQVALNTFAAETGMNTAGEGPMTILGDLLGDLMHWCDRHDVDFEAALLRAREYYEAETRGEES